MCKVAEKRIRFIHLNFARLVIILEYHVNYNKLRRKYGNIGLDIQQVFLFQNATLVFIFLQIYLSLMLFLELFCFNAFKRRSQRRSQTLNAII